jgi:bifunctional pyridoxal-dependent enzyme with beta-cystathionase and maltose regulon repressor activities
MDRTAYWTRAACCCTSSRNSPNIVGSSRLRDRWGADPPDIHGVAGVLGVEATLAAWREGENWLAGLVNHLHRNRDRLVEGLTTIDGISLRTPQAGYLAWVDCSGARPGADVAQAGCLLRSGETRHLQSMSQNCGARVTVDVRMYGRPISFVL